MLNNRNKEVIQATMSKTTLVQDLSNFYGSYGDLFAKFSQSDDNGKDKSPIVSQIAGTKFMNLILKSLLYRNMESPPSKKDIGAWITDFLTEFKTKGQITLKNEEEIQIFLRKMAQLHLEALATEADTLRMELDGVEAAPDGEGGNENSKGPSEDGGSDADTDILEDDDMEVAVDEIPNTLVKSVSKIFMEASDPVSTLLLDDVGDDDDDESSNSGGEDKAEAKETRTKVRADKEKRSVQREDLRLARKFNAVLNRRRYKLRSRIRKMPSLRGTVFHCNVCDFWAYKKRGLIQHKERHNH